MSVEYKPVCREHLDYLVDNMREADRKELAALSTIDPYHLLEASIIGSTLCCSAFIDGVLNCIVGVCPGSNSPLNVVGVPWMIATIHMTKNKKAFVSEYGGIIKEMLNKYSLLENYVDIDNKSAIFFLRKAGFEIHEAKPIGVDGHLFYRFTMGV